MTPHSTAVSAAFASGPLCLGNCSEQPFSPQSEPQEFFTSQNRWLSLLRKQCIPLAQNFIQNPWTAFRIRRAQQPQLASKAERELC